MRSTFEQRDPSRTSQTLVTCASVLLALLARQLADPYLGGRLAFSAFYAAVAISAWYGRFPQSVAAAVAGFLLGTWFFVPPRHTLDPSADLIGAVAYVLNAGLIIFLSERMHTAQRAASKSAKELQTVLSSIREAVIASDNQARVVYLNQKAEELTGWKASEVVGKPLTNVLKINNDHRQPDPDLFDRVLDQTEIVGGTRQLAMISRDGKVVPIVKSASPLVDSSGTVCGLVLVIHGLADEKSIETPTTQFS